MSQCNLMLDLICHGGMLTTLSHRMIGPFELVDFMIMGILILSYGKRTRHPVAARAGSDCEVQRSPQTGTFGYIHKSCPC